MTHKESLRLEALAVLRKQIRPGDTITTLVTHVTRSNMCRRIRLFRKSKEGLCEITLLVARVIGCSTADAWPYGMRVHGCGMDMCFWAVYQLGCSLFPKGGPLKHSDRRRQEERDGKTKEVNGGYLLRRRDL